MLDKNWFSTCAPIGVLNREQNSWNVRGAGVFIWDNPFIWYVTAHHLITDVEINALHVLVNHQKDKQCLVDIYTLHKQHKINWINLPDYDLAATVFPSDPNFMVKGIDFNLCISLKETIPSMRCYSLGCPYGKAGSDVTNVNMGVLDGIVSLTDVDRIYVTVPTFLGNSGGPLLVENKSNIYLGGIISESEVVSEIHLSKVIPAETIVNFLKSPEATKIKEKIKILPGSER